MTVVFGHPTGNQGSFQAALAHFEAGWLESFCVSWMPTERTLRLLGSVPGLRSKAGRLSRRRFPVLESAPISQSPIAELRRLAMREARFNSDLLADDANKWLMRRMRAQVRNPAVTTVHGYEDCSLAAFEEAGRRGKACVYTLPTGFFPWWERARAPLLEKYSDWATPNSENPATDRDRKRKELERADVVLAISNFVARTVLDEYPEKPVRLISYGIDVQPSHGPDRSSPPRKLRFLYAGQCSIPKGVPLLIKAWRAAALRDAELTLVGSWRLAESKKADLPPNCVWAGPVSREHLGRIYSQSDVFVFPTYYEGFGMVVLEAMAAGLPVIMTDGQGAADIAESAGRLFPADDLDALVASLRWFDANRDELPRLSQQARKEAESRTWARYRRSVTEAVRPYV